MQSHLPQCHLWTSILPLLVVFEWHISAPWATLLSASDLPRTQKRVTHIRDASFSPIKRFASELPNADKQFELTVLTSKCQALESQKNTSSSWAELCSGAAPFGSAAFTLLLWEAGRLQSSICFPLRNQSNDPICHFGETAAAPARGSRGRRQRHHVLQQDTIRENGD